MSQLTIDQAKRNSFGNLYTDEFNDIEFVFFEESNLIVDLQTNLIWATPKMFSNRQQNTNQIDVSGIDIGGVTSWFQSMKVVQDFGRRVKKTSLTIRFTQTVYCGMQEEAQNQWNRNHFVYTYDFSRDELTRLQNNHRSRTPHPIYPYSEQWLNKLKNKSRTDKVLYLIGKQGFEIDKTVVKIKKNKSKAVDLSLDSTQKLMDKIFAGEEPLTGYPWSRKLDDRDGLWEFHSLLVKNTPKHLQRVSATGFARDPQKDVAKDGFVCIDFGTSSTVVGYFDGKQSANLLRLEDKHEHSTLLYFSDSKFFDNWKAQTNRPLLDTKCFAYGSGAKSHLMNYSTGSGSSKLQGFYRDLKQSLLFDPKAVGSVLTGDNEEQLLTLSVPAKKSLSPNEADKLNALELYAYLLGMRINTREQLFTKYYMTFPVKYTREQKDIILAAFKRGLLRSLPATLVYQLDFSMDVEEQINEPTAFAIEALSQFLEEPEDEDVTTPFAIFDFGGGTTDFTFGAYTQYVDEDDNDGYYNTLEYFGCSGDPKLGGENILWKLAETVFLDNIETMIEQVIPFEGTSELIKPEGSERLFGPSYKARTNKTILMESLRDFWEDRFVPAEQSTNNIPEVTEEQTEFLSLAEVNQADAGITISEEESSDDVLEIVEDVNDRVRTIQLLNTNGDLVPLSLNFAWDKLECVLSDRLDTGILNFLSAMELAFRQHSYIDKRDDAPSEVLIVLAGNGARSKRLQSKMKALQSMDVSGEVLMERAFPNGVPAIELWDTTADTEKDFTCKTGVTLGLLRLFTPETRQDCFVQENTAENPEGQFAYYLGYSKRDRKSKSQIWRLIMEKNSDVNKWMIGPKIPSKGEALGCKDLYFTTMDQYKVDGSPFSKADTTHCLVNFTDFVKETVQSQSSKVEFYLQIQAVSSMSMAIKVVANIGGKQVSESSEQVFNLLDKI